MVSILPVEATPVVRMSFTLVKAFLPIVLRIGYYGITRGEVVLTALEEKAEKKMSAASWR